VNFDRINTLNIGTWLEQECSVEVTTNPINARKLLPVPLTGNLYIVRGGKYSGHSSILPASEARRSTVAPVAKGIRPRLRCSSASRLKHPCILFLVLEYQQETTKEER